MIRTHSTRTTRLDNRSRHPAQRAHTGRLTADSWLLTTRREHGRSGDKPVRGGTQHVAPAALAPDNRTSAYAAPCGDGGVGPGHRSAPRRRGDARTSAQPLGRWLLGAHAAAVDSGARYGHGCRRDPASGRERADLLGGAGGPEHGQRVGQPAPALPCAHTGEAPCPALSDRGIGHARFPATSYGWEPRLERDQQAVESGTRTVESGRLYGSGCTDK